MDTSLSNRITDRAIAKNKKLMILLIFVGFIIKLYLKTIKFKEHQP